MRVGGDGAHIDGELVGGGVVLGQGLPETLQGIGKRCDRCAWFGACAARGGLFDEGAGFIQGRRRGQ
ncbi:hypothetical protein ACTG9Q_32325 [Actinokineospora sp. 24-640]